MMLQQVYVSEDMHEGIKRKTNIILPPTQVPKQNIFAEAILGHTSARQKRHPLTWAVSLGAHMAVLAVLLLIPLYFSQGLSLGGLNSTLLVAPLPPAAAPP